jgi:hypothetical protein
VLVVSYTIGSFVVYNYQVVIGGEAYVELNSVNALFDSSQQTRPAIFQCQASRTAVPDYFHLNR